MTPHEFLLCAFIVLHDRFDYLVQTTPGAQSAMLPTFASHVDVVGQVGQSPPYAVHETVAADDGLSCCCLIRIPQFFGQPLFDVARVRLLALPKPTGESSQNGTTVQPARTPPQADHSFGSSVWR
jgi:hypothetical protein